MAALTRSGARKASEIVMFTFRTLQPSRPAMLSVFAAGSAMSSSCQRRPRAIDATRTRMSKSTGGQAPLELDKLTQLRETSYANVRRLLKEVT
jgi:hypothetical protein